ncbi:hypothetical protein [Pyrobaculum aerophilum]|uniref:Uncharacterized protein n=1 Tax=Pyrobaculum aerophilum TaxID=13773 RepID=A0A371QZC2_9CREN|nr:hypothetical protein [Pyrobaculum aerophilum]RFA95814.1 hypothetical protein CGL52_12185 [Pyrobaculum aerophilum]RFA96171.1 hypothetical protein CGL51_05760 [Pyrobaculum aerophilum]
MIEEYVELAAVTALAVIAIAAFAHLFAHTTTPAVCQAVRLVAENPGSELVVYGRLRYETVGSQVLLCGLIIEKYRIIIEKTEGTLRIGSTAEGVLYIR